MGLLTPQITRPLFGEGGGAANEATNPTLHTGTSLHVHSHTDVTLIHPTICTHILSSQKQTLQTLMHPPHPIPCTLTHPHIVPFQLQHIASFPDLPQLQFLIACSLQIKLEAGKASTQHMPTYTRTHTYNTHPPHVHTTDPHIRLDIAHTKVPIVCIPPTPYSSVNTVT